MSNNFLPGTHLLYTCIAQLFSAMLCYGFAPRLFLRSTMIPIPKEGRSSSSNSNHFRSIAISSILSNILDYIRTQNSELRILFNIIHEDCNKLVIVTIIKITVLNGKNTKIRHNTF